MNILLEERLEDFDAVDNEGKFNVSSAIVNTVKERGGRFLRPDGAGSWEVVSDADARNKIAHDFRTIRKRLKGSNEDKKRAAKTRSSPDP